MYLQSVKFDSRELLISRVRDFGKQRGFNICIPRGDITLQDGTLQVTLYCHKYGIKRKRGVSTVGQASLPMYQQDRVLDSESGLSPQSLRMFSDKMDKNSAINQYSKTNHTKKTNCPFRLKFIKKQEGTSRNKVEFFEFFEAIHRHNHELIVSVPKGARGKKSLNLRKSFENSKKRAREEDGHKSTAESSNTSPVQTAKF